MTHTTTECTPLHPSCPLGLVPGPAELQNCSGSELGQGPPYQCQASVQHCHYRMPKLLCWYAGCGTAQLLSKEMPKEGLGQRHEDANTGLGHTARPRQKGPFPWPKGPGSPKHTATPPVSWHHLRLPRLLQGSQAAQKPWLATRMLLRPMDYWMDSGIPRRLLLRPVTSISYGSQVVASKSIWSLSRNAQDRYKGWDVCLGLLRENITAICNPPRGESTDTLQHMDITPYQQKRLFQQAG